MSCKDEFGMLPKQRAFADFFLKGATATEALRKAEYQNSFAERAAHKLLRHPGVRSYLKVRREELSKVCGIDQEVVVRYLMRVIWTPISKAMEGEEELLQSKRVQTFKDGTVRFRVRMVDKMEALRKLTTMMGWDKPERQVVEVEVGSELLEMARRAVEGRKVPSGQ